MEYIVIFKILKFILSAVVWKTVLKFISLRGDREYFDWTTVASGNNKNNTSMAAKWHLKTNCPGGDLSRKFVSSISRNELILPEKVESLKYTVMHWDVRGMKKNNKMTFLL